MHYSLDGSGKLWLGGAERSEAQQPATLGANSKTGAEEGFVAWLQEKIPPWWWRDCVIRIGFEPMAYSLEGCCSIQLSYRTIPTSGSDFVRAKVRAFMDSIAPITNFG